METSFKEDPLIESLSSLLGVEKNIGKDSKGKLHKGNSWDIHAFFDNYKRFTGDATGALVFSIKKGFWKGTLENPKEFYLYTSGINWVILPIGVNIDSKHDNDWIINEVFMYTENKLVRGDKLSNAKTKSPKKITTKQKELQDQIRRDGGYTPAWSYGHKDGRYKDGYKFSNKKKADACRTYGYATIQDRDECPQDWVRDPMIGKFGPPPKSRTT